MNRSNVFIIHLNLPTSVVITGIDKQEILEQAFEAVKTFRLMSEEEVGALIAKTQKVAAAGEYELLRPAPTLITPPNVPIGWEAIARRSRHLLRKAQGKGFGTSSVGFVSSDFWSLCGVIREVFKRNIPGQALRCPTF